MCYEHRKKPDSLAPVKCYYCKVKLCIAKCGKDTVKCIYCNRYVCKSCIMPDSSDSRDSFLYIEDFM